MKKLVEKSVDLSHLSGPSTYALRAMVGFTLFGVNCEKSKGCFKSK